MQEAPFKGDLSHSKRCLLEHVIVEPDSLKFEGHMLKGVVSRAKALQDIRGLGFWRSQAWKFCTSIYTEQLIKNKTYYVRHRKPTKQTVMSGIIRTVYMSSFRRGFRRLFLMPANGPHHSRTLMPGTPPAFH